MKAIRWVRNLAVETFKNIPWWVWTIIIITIGVSTSIWGVTLGVTLFALSGVAFGQNMAFTAVSRSRNAGDILYHRKCAWLSNGVWLLCSMFIWTHLFSAFENKSYVMLIPLFVIYIASTTEGSVSMMARLLKTEKGKRRVGANEKIGQLEITVNEMRRELDVLVATQITL
jgi:hypothetical protein